MIVSDMNLHPVPTTQGNWPIIFLYTLSPAVVLPRVLFNLITPKD